jgi:hypothetical protein
MLFSPTDTAVISAIFEITTVGNYEKSIAGEDPLLKPEFEIMAGGFVASIV